jgi:hypothetical protein
LPQAHRPGGTGAQRFEQRAGCLDGVGGQTERPGEYVRRAGRHDAESWYPRMQAVGQQAVDDLVDSAVATQRDHDVGAVAHGPAGQRGCVPAIGGFDDLQLGVAAQGVCEHVALPVTGSGGPRIGYDEHTHGGHTTRQ